MLERHGLTHGGDLNKLDQELGSGVLPLEENCSNALHLKPELLRQLALGGC